jgi:flavodoxin
MERRVLVVYYSRTGTTEKVAREIARRLGADLEQLADTTDRSGALGYLASVKDALLKRSTELEAVEHDPAEYDLCVIGTPVWAWSVSVPVRTYLSQVRERLPEVAFFCTTGGTGIDRTFRVMRELTGRKPLAVLGLKMKDVLKGEPAPEIEGFCARLRAAAEEGG